MDFCLHYKILHDVSTVKTRFTDNRLTQTPHYYMDSLLLPWGKKALTFSLNSTCLIRTPTDADTFYEHVSVCINSSSVGQLQLNFLSGRSRPLPSHSDPVIKGGWWWWGGGLSKTKIFWPFGPQFGLKLREPGPPSPSPRSATVPGKLKCDLKQIIQRS